jgi:tetratricopeptide (TPR) repeat protein
LPLNRYQIQLPLAVLLLAGWCFGADSGEARYVGAKVCAACHKDIAASQTKMAMANTWHGVVTTSLPANYRAEAQEGSPAQLHYEIKRSREAFTFSAKTPDDDVHLPVETIIGGQRHGLSFLARIDSLRGMPLARTALIEGRYVYNSPHRALALSPGFEPELPGSYASAFGRVLSPAFEKKCLTCHGEPGTLGAGREGGVRCESCHGAGLQHVQAAGRGTPKFGMTDLKTLTPDQNVEICAQCHNGFSEHSDPLPDDTLVSNQATALRHSECFIQSGKGLGCTGCHNPHEDSAQLKKVSEAKCISCHSATKNQAAICPVNPAAGCVGCHMPTVAVGVFHMSDHWIRVHPETGSKTASHGGLPAGGAGPLREFLRIIVADERGKAEAAAQRISGGEAFAKVAHDLSSDATAPGGGYIGETTLADMNPALAEAAAKLAYGETSRVVTDGSRHILLYRMPRDFKEDANRLYKEAETLKEKGDIKGAVLKAEEALATYPYFLRALTLLGGMFGAAGDLQHGAEVLQFAAQEYPQDATAQFDLGLILGGLRRNTEQIAAFRHANELDPDNVAIYESLGAALYSAGEWQPAIAIFRRGLAIDPLAAELYFDLSLALKEHGSADESEAARKLAIAIDRRLAARLSAK